MERRHKHYYTPGLYKWGGILTDRAGDPLRTLTSLACPYLPEPLALHLRNVTSDMD